MQRVLKHLRGNAVAYLALFVALGGTSYAAVNLPAGSVGNRQLRNGAVTNKKIANGAVSPAKLNGKDISGSVAMWARISASGTVVASRPHAQILGWTAVDAAGHITWGRAISAGCFSLATVDGVGAEGFATVATLNRPHPTASVFVGTFNPSGQPAPEPVNVAVICP
jgi:hypothetical protein